MLDIDNDDDDQDYDCDGMDALPQTTVKAHSHQWIDPAEPPIARAPYSPIIGTLRRQMKHGTTYVCRECSAQLAP